MENEQLFQNAKNLLFKKMELLSNLLLMCEKANFLGEEEEIESYINFLAERQTVIDEVAKVDNLISSITTMINAETKTSKSLNNVDYLQSNNLLLQSKKEEIKKIVEKIIIKDDIIRVNMNSLLSSLKNSATRINVGRNAKFQYNNLGSYDNGGSFIDTKN